ncbi:MAG: hypothetical protein JRH07_01325 [Deltaproteobacteria bacterium]|nr:hypothetical protein [Deltaproteobacteria bacterium]
MDSRERVGLAIRHCETDRIPTGEIFIADETVAAFLGVQRVDFDERVQFVERLGIDAVCVSPQWQDQSSHLPAPGDTQWKDLDQWARETDRFVFAMVDGVFGWGARLMGFEAFLQASTKGSEELLGLIHGVERLNINLAKKTADRGAHGIVIAEDIAYKGGTIVSPDTLRDLFFPSLSRQVEGIRHLKIPVFFHSDGNLNPVMDDLVAIGFDGIQCLEPQAGMDLARLKAAYGRRVCLWGNLDPRELFLKRTPGEIQEAVSHIIEAGAPHGGFIFGTCSGIVAGMRPENLALAYRVVGEWGSSSRS